MLSSITSFMSSIAISNIFLGEETFIIQDLTLNKLNLLLLARRDRFDPSVRRQDTFS